MEEAAAGKALLPTVDNLTDGTMSRLVAAERRVRRPGTLATRVSGPRYRGAGRQAERTIKNCSNAVGSIHHEKDIGLFTAQFTLRHRV